MGWGQTGSQAEGDSEVRELEANHRTLSSQHWYLPGVVGALAGPQGADHHQTTGAKTNSVLEQRHSSLRTYEREADEHLLAICGTGPVGPRTLWVSSLHRACWSQAWPFHPPWATHLPVGPIHFMGESRLGWKVCNFNAIYLTRIVNSPKFKNQNVAGEIVKIGDTTSL